MELVKETGGKYRHSRKMQKPSTFVVKFYADWCGHCKSLIPEWKKLTRQVKGHPIKLININSENVPNGIAHVKKLTGVSLSAPRGFPTIVLIHGSKVREYAGERTAAALFQWASKGGDPEPSQSQTNGWFGGRTRRQKRGSRSRSRRYKK